MNKLFHACCLGMFSLATGPLFALYDPGELGPLLIETADEIPCDPADLFGPAQEFDTGDFPSFVAIGDVNGDSKPDLAVADQYSDTVSVLLNQCVPLPSGTREAWIIW